LWVAYRISEEDLVQYSRDHGFFLGQIAVRTAIGWLLAAGLVLDTFSNVTGVLLAWLLGVAAVGLGVRYYRFSLRRMARRWCRQTPGMTGEYLVEITPEGLFWSGALGEGTAKWLAFSQVRGTPHALCFCQGQQSAMIIPRRAFASPEEADAFLQAAARWHAAAAVVPVR